MCALPAVRNMISKVRDVCLFCRNSLSIQEWSFDFYCSSRCNWRIKTQTIAKLCKTTWAEWHETYTHFYQKYIFIYLFGEVLISHTNDLHRDIDYQDGRYATDWDCKSKQESFLYAGLNNFIWFYHHFPDCLSNAVTLGRYHCQASKQGYWH